MEYLAGNIEAVRGELNNASTKSMQYDAGEVEAVRSIVQGNVDANKIYSCGGSTGSTALLAAMTGYTPTPSPTPGGGSGGSVTSKTYAELASNRKVFGTAQLQAVNASIVTSGGTNVSVKAVDNGDSTVTVYPQTYYIDSQTTPLTTISQSFDLYMDENGYLKIIIGSTENFIYINAAKTVKVSVTSVSNDTTHTPKTSLFTDDSTSVDVNMTFNVCKSDGSVATAITLRPDGNNSTAIGIVATNFIYTNKISTRNEIYMIINIPTYKYNFKIVDNQLVLRWNSVDYPLYFDKVTTSDGTHTQPVECSYLEIQ
jgi:hypothetical protein